MQSALITQLFSGTRWRLGGLSSGQARAVTQDLARTSEMHEFDEFDRELFLALQHDGRLSFRDLAAAVGRPEATVRRRVGLLIRSGVPAFRTDFRTRGSRLADWGHAQVTGDRVGGGRGGTRAGPLLRPVKSWGQIFGPDGRVRQVVPVDLWAPVG